MIGVIFALAFAALACLKVTSLLQEGKRLREPGFMTSAASFGARIARTLFARLVLRLAIGRLVIEGAEQLKYKGRLLIMPTHQILQDAMVMAAVLGLRQFRYLVLDTQITPARAPFAALLGAIIVPSGTSKWLAARKAIRALRAEPQASLLVFPQGRRMHEKPLNRADFQDGALFIGKHVEAQSQEPMPALTMAICYDRDPNHATKTRRFLKALGLEKWIKRVFSDTTYGVTLVIDEARPLSSFGDDLKSGTDKLFQRSQELMARAQALTHQ